MGIQETLIASTQSLVPQESGFPQLQVTPARSGNSRHDCVCHDCVCPNSIQTTLLPWEQEASRSCQLLLCKVLLDSSSEATFRKHFWGLISVFVLITWSSGFHRDIFIQASGTLYSYPNIPSCAPPYDPFSLPKVSPSTFMSHVHS